MADETTPMARPAACVPGHLDEGIQGRSGPDGPVALVTLTCPAVTATARALFFVPSKAPDGAGATLREAGLPGVPRFLIGAAA